MQIFVTGGSGFLGRRLIPYLTERGHAVRALARSDKATATVVSGGAEPVAGELGDLVALTSGMKGCQAVIHAAGKVEQWGSPDAFFQANVQGTENVLRCAAEAGVKRFVHVGTEAVLADGAPIINADEKRPRTTKPMGLYPWSKGLAEARVLAANTPRMETISVRPRLIWGRGDTTILPQLVSLAKAGRFAWIGGGDYLTSTCHVDNVCEGLLCALEQGVGGEIYFLTDGAPIKWRDFITAMLATQGVDAGNRSVPRWVARAIATAGELAWRTLPLAGSPPLTRTALALTGHEVTVVDDKARREIGYTSAMTRQQGLEQMKAPA